MVLFTFACGEEITPEPTPDKPNPGPGPGPSAQTWSVAGSVQKGPFTQGTTITIQALDETLNPTGKNYSTKTTDDAGSFGIGSQIESRYVEIMAVGYYFNEIEGKVSASTLTLRSLSDLSEEGKTNVNLLTTLESDRMRELVKGGKTVAEARKQAEEEIFGVFNIPNAVGDAGFDKMDITSGTDADAILLAISASLQAGRSVGELSELISKIAGEVANTGSLTSELLRGQITESCMLVDADAVRANLTRRYQALGKADFVIPPFEDYLDVNGNGVIDKKDSWIILGQDDFVVSDKGGSFELTLQSNVEFEVSVEGGNWLSWQPVTRAYLADATIVFTAEPNEETDARYAVIKIKDRATAHVEKATVTQKQKDALTVSAESVELEKAGGTFDITVAHNADVQVNYDDAPWLSLVQTRAMTTNILTFSASANPGVGTRVGHIVFSIPNADASGTSPESVFNQNSTWGIIGSMNGDTWTRDISMKTDGTWHAAFGITVTSSDEFKFRKDAGWTVNYGADAFAVTVVSSNTEVRLSQGGGNLKLAAGTYDFYLNPDKAIAYFLPTGSPFVQGGGSGAGGLSETVTVYQKGGRTLVLSASEITVGFAGGTVSVQATTNIDYEVFGPNVAWMTLQDGAGTQAAVTDSYSWTVQANTTGEARQAVIVFKDKESDLSQTVTVAQEQNPVIEGSTVYKIGWEGGSFDVELETNFDYTASIEQEGNWLSIVSTRAMHSSAITLVAQENPNIEPRTAYLWISAAGQSWGITITQRANAQQVTVHVATPGTLSQVIDQDELHKIVNLKITGELNEDDLELLKGGSYNAGGPFVGQEGGIECDWCVEELDLSEMTTTTDATGGVFQYVPSLVKVKMPLHVEKVSPGAFRCCQSLETIDFGTDSDILIIGASLTVTMLGKQIITGAFTECTALKSVTLPDNLEEFWAGAFNDCTSLQEIIFPQTCNVRTLRSTTTQAAMGGADLGQDNTVGTGMFHGCTSLETVNIPPSVRKIWAGAFQGAQFRKLVIPETVTSIVGDYLFDSCTRLEEVTLPSCVTEYSTYMFSNCVNLKKINTAATITRYGDYCFSGANAAMLKLSPDIHYGSFVFARMDCESLTIPDWMTTIPNGMFAYWQNLKNLDLGNVEEIGEFAFFTNTLSRVVLPESVRSIGDEAFYSYSETLTSLEIRSRNIVFGSGSYGVFRAPLSNVVIANTVRSINGRIGSGIIGEGLTTLTGITFEEGSILEEFGGFNNTGIKTLSLPSSVKRISSRALSYTPLRSIDLPDGLEYIGEAAFSNCSELRRFSVPAKVDTIEVNAFSNCAKLYEFSIPSTSSLKYIGGNFAGCDNLDPFVLNGSETLVIGGALGVSELTIGKNIKILRCPEGTSINSWRMKKFQVEEGSILEEIWAAPWCRTTAVSLPSSLKVIGDYLFCFGEGTVDADNRLDVPGFEGPLYADFSNVVSIGKNAFSWFKGKFNGEQKFETLDLPAIQRIGDNAFSDTSLKIVTFGPSLTEIGNEIFHAYEYYSYQYPSERPLEEIHFQGQTPPQTMSSRWLYGYSGSESLKIYVPASAYQNYYNAWNGYDWWSKVQTE